MYYIAHRLFAAHDRALAADLAHRLALKLGEEQVFLPFCDTDEEGLIADVKGRELFELDCVQLRDVRALIAFVHGPSPDDGVCMEIGYAVALGAPIILVTTDFQEYSTSPSGTRLFFPDPLLEALATRVVRVPLLGPPPAASGTSHYADFAARNHAQVQQAMAACVDAVLRLPAASGPPAPARTAGTAYVEPSPYAAEGPVVPGLAAAGPAAPAGVTVRPPGRFTSDDPVEAARADWASALSSERVLVDASGPETPPGAALLIGAARAVGIPVAAYLPRSILTHAAGAEPHHRNLMIQYGVDRTLRSGEEALAWLRP